MGLLELAVLTHLDMMLLHRHLGENSTDQQNNVFQPGAFGLLDDNEARGFVPFFSWLTSHEFILTIRVQLHLQYVFFHRTL